MSSNFDQQTTVDGDSIVQSFTTWHQHKSDAPPNEQLSDTPAKNTFGARKPNATLIQPRDAPEHYNRFQKLDSHNRDNAWKYRSEIDLSKRAIHEMKLDMMEALGTQLEVGNSLISIGTREIFRLDLGKIGLPTCAVGFCLYVHLYDEATTAYEAGTPNRVWTTSPGTNRPYWPFRNSDSNLPSFNRVADNLISFHSNVTESSLQSLLQRLSQGALPTRVGGYRPTNTDLPSK